MEPTRIKLAALWMVVMCNIIFADIIGFLHPGTLENMLNGTVGFPITSEMLLLASVFAALPSLMIFLSLVLPATTLRWLSTLVVLLTSLFVLGGGSATLSYGFFVLVELTSMAIVLWYAWKRLATQAHPASDTPTTLVSGWRESH